MKIESEKSCHLQSTSWLTRSTDGVSQSASQGLWTRRADAQGLDAPAQTESKFSLPLPICSTWAITGWMMPPAFLKVISLWTQMLISSQNHPHRHMVTLEIMFYQPGISWPSQVDTKINHCTALLQGEISHAAFSKHLQTHNRYMPLAK